MTLEDLINLKCSIIKYLPEMTSGDLLKLLAEINKEIDARYL